MPIIIPDAQAAATGAPYGRSDSAIVTVGRARALRQDARPLRLILLNLAGGKLEGDLRIARLLGNTPIQVELTLLRPDSSHEPEVSAHLLQFYRNFAEVQDDGFDALIILGASTANRESEQATADEQERLLEWSLQRVRSHLFIGQAAYVALSRLHGFRPRRLSPELIAVYPHEVVTPGSPLLRGHDRIFDVPVYRSCSVYDYDAARFAGVSVLASAPEAGVHLLHDQLKRQTFFLNDITMDGETLRREARRLRPVVATTPAGASVLRSTALSGWQAHIHLFFANWLAHDVMTVPG